MSIPLDKPWTEEEKVLLLTEIIRADKSVRLNSRVLFELVRQHQIEPKWRDTPLPPGRTLNSCMIAFQEMQALPSPHLHRGNVLPPIHPQNVPPSSRKHTLPLERPTTDRMILPRPANLEQSNGGENLVISQVSPSEIFEPPRKKRGRPSNKDLQDRRTAAILRGEPYESPRTSTSKRPKKTSVSTTSSGNLGVPDPVRPPAVSPDPLQLPQPPPTAKSSDSSGGRKRKRVTKSNTPNSPSSPSKKREARRSGEHSPIGAAAKAFPSTQQAIAISQHPRGSIEGLLSQPNDPPPRQKLDDRLSRGTGATEIPTTTPPSQGPDSSSTRP